MGVNASRETSSVVSLGQLDCSLDITSVKRELSPETCSRRTYISHCFVLNPSLSSFPVSIALSHHQMTSGS